MDDYIHRKSLLKALEEQRIHALDQSFKIAMNMAEGIVEQQPAADVEEVRHGEPKLNKGDSAKRYYCPFCYEYLKPENHYCPNCGAKMDKEKEEL